MSGMSIDLYFGVPSLMEPVPLENLKKAPARFVGRILRFAYG
jgi:hypothetical protein